MKDIQDTRKETKRSHLFIKSILVEEREFEEAEWNLDYQEEMSIKKRSLHKLKKPPKKSTITPKEFARVNSRGLNFGIYKTMIIFMVLLLAVAIL